MSNTTYTRAAETGVITLKIDDETFTSVPEDEFNGCGKCEFNGDARCEHVACTPSALSRNRVQFNNDWIIWVRKP